MVVEVYSKKTPREHILLRPDMYIGSTIVEQLSCVVRKGVAVKPGGGLAGEPNPPLRTKNQSTAPIAFERVTLPIVEGLVKIFDEVLVNAADNRERDVAMRTLRVTVDRQTGTITVFNDGQSLPIERYKEDNAVYIAEMVFGQLLTSSNFNDTQGRVVGGRFGYGAKLANIWSTEFTIVLESQGQRYKQTWHENMARVSKPHITALTGSKTRTSTTIVFTPDYVRFGMVNGIDAAAYRLMERRVIDLAGTLPPTVAVSFNGERLAVKSFVHFASLFAPCESSVYYECDRWQVVVMASATGEFQQTSFVNNIATGKGGRHVGHVVDQVLLHLALTLNKKKSALKIPNSTIKNNLRVFIAAKIVNPSFDSQSKTFLTSKVTEFGSTCALPPAFLAKVVKRTTIVHNIMAVADVSAHKALKKTDGCKKVRISGIPKFDDAALAGTAQSDACTIILTEGDSAAALAKSGLSVLGRERYAVYPLRGKLLNVRDASAKAVLNNSEVAALKTIIGLKQGEVYANTKKLRFGHVLIMADQVPTSPFVWRCWGCCGWCDFLFLPGPHDCFCRSRL
jgi:DNA topoisomerase-2